MLICKTAEGDLIVSIPRASLDALVEESQALVRRVVLAAAGLSEADLAPATPPAKPRPAAAPAKPKRLPRATSAEKPSRDKLCKTCGAGFHDDSRTATRRYCDACSAGSPARAKPSQPETPARQAPSIDKAARAHALAALNRKLDSAGK